MRETSDWIWFGGRSRRALEHRKNMDEDRLAELEQLVKDASESVMETEKRFAEVTATLTTTVITIAYLITGRIRPDCGGVCTAQSTGMLCSS